MPLFTIYTYQFKPYSKHTQALLFEESYSPEYAMENKNKILASIIKEINFSRNKREYSSQFLIQDSNIISFRLANKKVIRVEKNFKTQELVNEPSIHVIINNSYNIQRILIEPNTTVFSDTNSVANILEKSINKAIEKYNLVISIKREFQVSEFWSIVHEYEQNIQMVRFEFDFPNLPKLYTTIKDTIKLLSKSTASEKTKVELNSNPDESLQLDNENESLNDLTNSSAISGNNIIFKVKGLRKHITTGKTIRTTEVDEMFIQTNNIEELEQVFKSLDES